MVLGGPEVSYETEGQEIVQLADYVITGEADLEFARVCGLLLTGEPTPNPSKEGNQIKERVRISAPLLGGVGGGFGRGHTRTIQTSLRSSKIPGRVQISTTVISGRQRKRTFMKNQPMPDPT